MPQPLLPTRFLFRFSAPCRRREPLWTPDGDPLDETYRLAGLTELEGRAAWADVRAAWSQAGLVFAVHVKGKKKGDRPASSGDDGLYVWIDTRDVHNVHRAGRFCHQFRFRPKEGAGVRGRGAEVRGQGSGRTNPKTKSRNPKVPDPCTLIPDPFFPAVAEWLPINRAREQPRPIAAGVLQARCQRRTDGYILEAFLPAESLTGFDPSEHPRLGFTYSVIDGELGEQTFGVGSPMPYQEDPSLWATLELQP